MMNESLREVTCNKVIIVLANEMSQQGELNAESQARADLAADLFLSGDYKQIITCGWDYRVDSEISIADAFEAYLVNVRQISSESIHAEIRSRDTVGDAVFTRQLVDENDLFESEFVVVTSNYHVNRTREIFTFVYGESAHISVIGSDSVSLQTHEQTENKSVEAFRASFAGVSSGDIDSIFTRMLKSHPFYNGEIHPQFQNG